VVETGFKMFYNFLKCQPVLKQVWKGWRQCKWTREKLGWREEAGTSRWQWQHCGTTWCFERAQVHAM